MRGLRAGVPLGPLRTLATWPARRWGVATLAAAATVLVVALPTALIPNPVFGREVAPTAWSWPVLLVTAVLSGLLTATYVRVPATPADDGEATGTGNVALDRTGAVGGLLTFFAVGCPVCNKVALLALGYAGAMQWFAPIQPWLAAAGVGLLAYALVRRLDGESRCPLPRPPATAASASAGSASSPASS